LTFNTDSLVYSNRGVVELIIRHFFFQIIIPAGAIMVVSGATTLQVVLLLRGRQLLLLHGNQLLIALQVSHLLMHAATERPARLTRIIRTILRKLLAVTRTLILMRVALFGIVLYRRNRGTLKKIPCERRPQESARP
jgi:hypothetical protein